MSSQRPLPLSGVKKSHLANAFPPALISCDVPGHIAREAPYAPANGAIQPGPCISSQEISPAISSREGIFTAQE